ncbi:MAG: hypothetical protein Q9225_003379 [Loekoesia sp. 1 TL-2023]
MAGMREHIRQMDEMNEDMIEEQQRFIGMIDRVTAKSPKSIPTIPYRHVRVSPRAHNQQSQHVTSASDEAEDS